MFSPKGQPALDTLVGNKDGAIFVPGLDPLGRARNGLDDVVLMLCLIQQCLHMLGAEAVLALHLLDKGRHTRVLGAVILGLGRQHAGGAQQHCRRTANQYRAGAAKQRKCNQLCAIHFL